MKYLSNNIIQESIRDLSSYNAFFSITFLVLKRNHLPIGRKRRLSLDAETKAFLKENFKVHPKSEYFFRVMRQSDRSKDWNKPNYASTGLQAVNTQTFRDALLHEKHDNTWGWSEDYIQRLADALPYGGRKIPLYNLAVWIYKYYAWDDAVKRIDVVNKFIQDYRITRQERELLFDTDIISDLSEAQSFQDLPSKWNDILAPYSQPPDIPTEVSGILTYLETESIGPVARLVFQPGTRLNIITGDNGLGKTFLLDLAWWALTQDWAERPAEPFIANASKPPLIKFAVGGPTTSKPIRASFNYPTGQWQVKERQASLSGLVVYARVDGSFAIWDPANRALANSNSLSHWPGLKFTRDEIWEGKPGQIEGLIRDWTRWQFRPDRYSAFSTFEKVLQKVLPPDLGNVTIGEPVRIQGDQRDIPTLVHSYSTVPILFESAGIRRIITLAYLLVWAWEEHKLQSKIHARPEERQMVVIIDEAEAHLHPKWQRVIIPTLMSIAADLHNELSVQWIIASHSPLALASAEAVWETESDRLYHLNMSMTGSVSFDRVEFEKRGTVDSWLSSKIFQLPQPGSPERENAIQNAIQAQQFNSTSKSTVEKITDQLRQYLGDEDPFWARWIFYADSFGVTP